MTYVSPNLAASLIEKETVRSMNGGMHAWLPFRERRICRRSENAKPRLLQLPRLARVARRAKAHSERKRPRKTKRRRTPRNQLRFLPKRSNQTQSPNPKSS